MEPRRGSPGSGPDTPAVTHSSGLPRPPSLPGMLGIASLPGNAWELLQPLLPSL